MFRFTVRIITTKSNIRRTLACSGIIGIFRERAVTSIGLFILLVNLWLGNETVNIVRKDCGKSRFAITVKMHAVVNVSMLPSYSMDSALPKIFSNKDIDP